MTLRRPIDFALGCPYAVRLFSHVMVAAIIVLAGCSRAPVVTITNHSTHALANVVVSGSGFSNRIDSIAARATSSLTVRPRGESAVRVTFVADGRSIDSGEQGYFEAGGGYRVAIAVEPDLKVTVSADLRGY